MENADLNNETKPLKQDGVRRRFLMEFMLDGKVERDEVDCEDWSKAKHFIQRKYKLQDEPRVILEKCECEEPNEEPIKICVNCNGYVE